MITLAYDPGADAAARYPEVTIRRRRHLGVPAAVWPRRRLILIDHDMPAADQRSHLAHEIAHLDLAHSDPICEGKEERSADLLAARRLLAIDDLADALCWALCDEEVADVLNVTADVVTVRIQNLTPDEKAYIRARHEAWGLS